MNTGWVACPLGWLTTSAVGRALSDSVDSEASRDELTAIVDGDPMSAPSIAPGPSPLLCKPVAKRNVVSAEPMAISADSAITG